MDGRSDYRDHHVSRSVGRSACGLPPRLNVGGVFLVDLSVTRPGVPVERGTQTVTTAKIAGRWYVDVFK